MEFRTLYNRLKVTSDSGSPIRIVRGPKYDKQKNLVVEDKGEENLYAYINSFKDSVDINVILNKFTNGDKEALNQRAGAYIDVSTMPTNINEFMDLTQNAEALFKTLPVEVKEKFNNNVMQFISEIGTEEFVQKMDTSDDQIRKEFVKNADEKTQIFKEAIKQPDVVENPAVDVMPEDSVLVNKGGKVR